MWKWVKKIFIKPKPEQKRIRVVPLPEEQDQEILELILLQDPICSKHHG